MCLQIDIQKLSELEERLTYKFSDKSLITRALTHSSYAYEARNEHLENNERLEFLGDGILDFVIAEELFKRKVKQDEGYLSQKRAMIVCEATLFEIAKDLAIGNMLLLGRGEIATNGREKPSNLANAIEAIFASIYLDGGFEAAKGAILHILSESIDSAISGQLVFDYKSRLIEYSQSGDIDQQISFAIIDENGPVHNKTFHAAAFFGEKRIGDGYGRSKKQAEQEAAKAALDSIGGT